MKKLIQLHENDNVGIAISALKAGERIDWEGRPLAIVTDINPGHKVAMCNIRAGEKVRRNNVKIGSATQDIAEGDHVHLQNLKSDYIPTLNKHYQDRKVSS